MLRDNLIVINKFQIMYKVKADDSIYEMICNKDTKNLNMAVRKTYFIDSL